MTQDNEAIKAEIVGAFGSGALLQKIFDHSSCGDESITFRTACVELHNEGKIDLLSLIDSSAFAAIGGSQFFVGQHFYCQAIPKLKASVVDLMRCVSALVNKGGQDLAASQPNGAFKAWCVADLDRAHEVIRASRNNDPLAKNFLTFALEALQLVEEAKKFVDEYTDERRLFGITALGRISYSDSQSAGNAFLTLKGALSGTDDDALIANILIAAFAIQEKQPDLGYAGLTEIAKDACAKPGPAVHNASARILTQYGNIFTSEVLALVLEGLESLDPSHKSTIQTLDVGLSQLLNGQFVDQIIDFVTLLLPSKQGALAFDEFQSFGSALINRAELFQKTLVLWLLSGEKSLCEGIGTLLQTHRRNERPLDLPIHALNLSPIQKVFLCRKAVGYLFLQSVVASSILISVLRSCEDDAAQAVSDILFDPLLRNYGGKIREYLGTITSVDPAYGHVQSALEAANKYLDDVKSAGIIKELHPSEGHRQTVRLRNVDDMRKIHKEAMKKSILASLVSRSTILHGRRTITYVDEPGNKRRPIEMNMNPHTVEFELPRMEITDPVGLDYLLRTFRSERLRA